MLKRARKLATKQICWPGGWPSTCSGGNLTGEPQRYTPALATDDENKLPTDIAPGAITRGLVKLNA